MHVYTYVTFAQKAYPTQLWIILSKHTYIKVYPFSTIVVSCLFRFSSSSSFLSILLAVEGLQNSILLFRHIMEHKSFTLFPEITWLRPLCRSCAQKELTGKTQQRAEPPHHMRSWRCFHVNLCKVSWDLATHYILRCFHFYGGFLSLSKPVLLFRIFVAFCKRPLKGLKYIAVFGTHTYNQTKAPLWPLYYRRFFRNAHKQDWQLSFARISKNAVLLLQN